MSEKLDLTRFEKKMVIRNIEEKDIDKIIDLQKDCFPGMEPWKREHLISHLEHFPEGQFCAEFEGEIIGSCSSLLMNMMTAIRGRTLQMTVISPTIILTA